MISSSQNVFDFLRVVTANLNIIRIFYHRSSADSEHLLWIPSAIQRWDSNKGGKQSKGKDGGHVRR